MNHKVKYMYFIHCRHGRSSFLHIDTIVLYPNDIHDPYNSGLPYLPNHFLIVDSVSTGIASKAESELFVQWCVSDDPIKFFDFLQGVVPNIGHYTQHYSKH